ncbi:MAG: hypothetical protein AVDCRST_MAG76-2751 [uncultured Acidimicrobiales bacterium]|uniref:Uncharacterized protein n=1 Tax=uncultured Acidimicrobiales bacterium TaxID=310071 RepID=A0A6J4IU63_9ACTN|nr:MAG: hypothetical protein AVDCRST_MAG76-2751 [uncultured Acidimicrobiales bacterium]
MTTNVQPPLAGLFSKVAVNSLLNLPIAASWSMFLIRRTGGSRLIGLGP